ELKGLVKEVQQLISTTIQTTRRISHDLLPPVLDKFGLVAALEELCEQSSRSDQLTVDFEVNDSELQPEEDTVKLNTFRIVQEMMSNSIRHGQATIIQIRLQLEQDNFILHYEDNGKGFDAAQIEEHKGLGLRNMDSRAKMMGAQITYESTPGQGMKARLSTRNRRIATREVIENIAKT
ncbi:MAG: ATP-binding protein, partial [Bacteroidota bacterium]